MRLRRGMAPRSADLERAIRRLDSVADARLLGIELAAELRRLTNGNEDAPSEERRVRVQVATAAKLYEGNRLTYEEYVFLSARPVIGIAEDRWLDDAYEDQLAPIRERMEAIADASYDEGSDTWQSQDAEREHERLEAEYESVLRRMEKQALEEFGLAELAALRERDPQAFERAFERGRRAFFHREEQTHALKDAIDAIQEEAELAGAAGAYSLGAAGYGAAIEGLLALRCMRSPKKARQLANEITGKKQPASQLRWNFELLIAVAEKAAWLPPFETEIIVHRTAGWADYLRQLRNRIHPPRVAREHAWTRLGASDFEAARAAFAVVAAALRSRKAFSRRPPSV